MKRTFTLLIVSFIAISLMGQSAIEKKRTEGQRAKTFNILKQIIKSNADLANPFYSPNDSKQAMDSLIYEEFHEFDGGWKNDEKEEYTWDANGKEILMMRSGWMVEQVQWFNYQKTEYSYNIDGKLSVVSTQMRDTPEMEWRNEIKTEFTYQGAEGIIVIMKMWNPELSQWVEYWKFEYVFNSNGKLVEIINYYNVEDPANWLNAEKYEYFYDGDGRMVQELWLLWDTDANVWENEYKVDYSYEGNGNLINEFWSQWNITTLEWENESKADFTYDEHGNISEYIESWWEFSLEDWLVEEKVLYTYNNTFTYSDLLLPGNYSGYYYTLSAILFNHMLLTEEVFEAWDESWDEDTRTNYFYSENNSSAVELNDDGAFLAYPNPATDFFTLDLNIGSDVVLVEVFDTRGKRVLSEEIVENQPISVSHLDKGVYVYKFVFNDKAYSGKLLVQ